MKAAIVEIRGGLPQKDLAARALSGEALIVRGCVNRAGLIEEIRAASLEGIRHIAGSEAADWIEHEGFQAIHQRVSTGQIPALTNRIYEIVTHQAADWLTRLVPELFGVRTPFYFEREPNVRFHLPYAVSQADRAAYRQFTQLHGGGKITAHGPHRDSWLDCPDNAINVWIAVGPVCRGNGMSFYLERYQAAVRHTESGSMASDESPGVPTNFELAPGDAVIFHGDQLHASELNRTDETRHVLSFRLTMDKPHFPNGHYHHYLHSSLASGRGSHFAGLPANLAWSYLATRVGWAVRELAAVLRKPGTPPGQLKREEDPFHSDSGTAGSVNVSNLHVGDMRAVSAKICLARTDHNRVVAFARRCPHEGADLSRGTLQEGRVVCPWHNVSFDLRDGKSNCTGLGDLRLYELSERGGQVKIAG